MFSGPVLGILGILLTAGVLEALFCEELSMGLRVSKVSASRDFGYCFRVQYGGWISLWPLRFSRHCFLQHFGWASKFQIILCLEILAIVFRAPYENNFLNEAPFSGKSVC